MTFNRITLIKFHLVLASFILPIFLLYLGSGLLYTFNIKGHIHKTEIPINLQQAINDDVQQVEQIVTIRLKQTEFSLPDNPPILKHKDGHSEVRWNRISQSFTFRFIAGEKSAMLVIRQRDLLTQVMRIHRAESGTAFKLLSLSMALTLCLVLMSGIYMALSSGKLGKISLIAVGCGILVFIGVLSITA